MIGMTLILAIGIVPYAIYLILKYRKTGQRGQLILAIVLLALLALLVGLDVASNIMLRSIYGLMGG